MNNQHDNKVRLDGPSRGGSILVSVAGTMPVAHWPRVFVIGLVAIVAGAGNPTNHPRFRPKRTDQNPGRLSWPGVLIRAQCQPGQRAMMLISRV